MDNKFVIIALIVIIIGQTLFYYYKSKKKEREIKEIIAYLTKVQNKLELPDLNRETEGQLGILKSEIYKVVNMLREAHSKELLEKSYMADLLSDIAHQIKTPIAAITIMVDLLESSELSEEARLEYADKIDKQANRITWLVKNLLTLSQLEADVIKFKEEEFKLEKMTSQIKETFEIMAELKNIELAIDVDEDIVLEGDYRWTLEAVSNIVKNAIEHTNENGKVEISAKQDNISTHLYIKDNGKGIDKEKLLHIFERFYKVDSSNTNSVGIGLALAKQIIMKQQGTIDVESELGKGTTFHIKIYR